MILYVLGMAKSYLDVKGSKPRNLEFDFLHLAFAVAKTNSPEAKAKGILLVLDERVRRRADGWRKKYGITDEIEVVLAKVSQNETEILSEEKIRNARANKPGADAADALAAKSQAIAELHLRAEIQRRFPDIRERRPHLSHLVCVNWDFCGVVCDEGGAA